MNHDVPEPAAAVAPLLEELAAATRAHNAAVTTTGQLKKLVDRLEIKLHKLMDDCGLRAASIDTCSVSVVTKSGYHATDWEKIYPYIAASGNWQVLKKALSATALRELENSNELPPGVTRTTWDELKVEVKK